MCFSAVIPYGGITAHQQNPQKNPGQPREISVFFFFGVCFSPINMAMIGTLKFLFRFVYIVFPKVLLLLSCTIGSSTIGSI